MNDVKRRLWVYAPLAFFGVGIALSAWSAGNVAPWPVIIGVAVFGVLMYWLGRRSKVENTAVAVAQAVSVAVAQARADAAAEATAQALNQVAVIVGDQQSRTVERLDSMDSDTARAVDQHDDRVRAGSLDVGAAVSSPVLAFEEFAARQVAREVARGSHQEAPPA